VLGLFDGLGWCAVAAAQLGNVNAVCVERDQKQVEIAYRRVNWLLL
jgi:hypothetical protein